jgi:hypothetical protein
MLSLSFTRTVAATMCLISVTYATAEDRRPQIIHTDQESCVYSYSGNQTYVECDKSAELMLKKFKQEEARIDRAERREYDLVGARQADEKASREKSNAEISKMEADMVARNPKGWACVMKKLPRGMTPSDATDSDMAKCTKAFNGK